MKTVYIFTLFNFITFSNLDLRSWLDVLFKLHTKINEAGFTHRYLRQIKWFFANLGQLFKTYSLQMHAEADPIGSSSFSSDHMRQNIGKLIELIRSESAHFKTLDLLLIDQGIPKTQLKETRHEK